MLSRVEFEKLPATINDINISSGDSKSTCASPLALTWREAEREWDIDCDMLFYKGVIITNLCSLCGEYSHVPVPLGITSVCLI